MRDEAEFEPLIGDIAAEIMARAQPEVRMFGAFRTACGAPQRAVPAVVDADSAKFGGVLADPAAAYAEHRRHGGGVDVVAKARLLAKDSTTIAGRVVEPA